MKIRAHDVSIVAVDLRFQLFYIAVQTRPVFVILPQVHRIMSNYTPNKAIIHCINILHSYCHRQHLHPGNNEYWVRQHLHPSKDGPK